METKNSNLNSKDGFKKLLIWGACILGAIVVCTTVGVLMDGVNNTYLGPSWSWVFSEGTVAAWAEKLVTCAMVGFMISIIPGGIIVLFSAALISTLNDSVKEADQIRDAIKPRLGEFDVDGDGVFSDPDLIPAYQKAPSDVKPLLAKLIRYRATAGDIAELEDGTSVISISAANLDAFPAKRREERTKILTIVGSSLVIFAILWFSNVWFTLGLAVLANVVLWVGKLKKKALLQRFLLREFDRLDIGGDGNADELELVRVWKDLAPEERPKLLEVLKHIGSIGHEINSPADGLSLRAISRSDVETYAPQFSKAFV